MVLLVRRLVHEGALRVLYTTYIEARIETAEERLEMGESLVIPRAFTRVMVLCESWR
jgi:hypothetical protein